MKKLPSHSSHFISVESIDGGFQPRYMKQGFKTTKQSLARWSAPSDTLLAWVSTSKSEGAARINRILELIVELVELKRGKGDEEEHQLAWQGNIVKVKVNLQKGRLPPETEREKLLAAELRLKLCHYNNLFPTYWTTIGDYPILGWSSGEERPRDEDDPTEEASYTEHDAIITTTDLARAGLVRKIRRCQRCRDWFFQGKYINQKFCGAVCQQKFYRSSEDYKAMHRDYVKALRAAHKKRYFTSPRDRNRKKGDSKQKQRPLGGKDDS